MSVTTPVTVRAAGGTVSTVSLRNADGKLVAGTFNADRTAWTSTEPLGYAHLMGRTRQFRGACANRQLFFDELAHQHKHAYVNEFGLGEHGVSAEMLFDGEPVLPSA